MLVEREVDANLLLECNTSNLVMSKLDPCYDQVWNLVDFDQQQLVDMKSPCMAYYLVLSTTIAAIPWSNYDLIWDLVAFNRATHRRHEVVSHCSFFVAEHDNATTKLCDSGVYQREVFEHCSLQFC